MPYSSGWSRVECRVCSNNLLMGISYRNVKLGIGTVL